MDDAELNYLWDPTPLAESNGGGLARALEARLAPIRRTRWPELELPARGESARSEAAPSPEGSWRALGAVALAIAAAVLVWVWLRPDAAVDDAQIARAPAPTIPGPSIPGPSIPGPTTPTPPALPGWQVAEFVGETQCADPNVKPEAALPDAAWIHTGEGAAKLSWGAGRVEVHPQSEIRRVGETLELARGRMWADAPVRDSTIVAPPWAFVVGTLDIHTESARFVAWAEDGTDGIEVHEGTLVIDDGHRTVTAEPGQTCEARQVPGPVEGMDALRCRPTPTTPE